MTEVDGYSSLPDELKEELRSLLSTNDPALLLRHNYRNGPLQPRDRRSGSGFVESGGSESSGSFSGERESTVSNPAVTNPHLANFKMDEEFHDANTLQFQSKLEELKVIVGSEVTDELLKDLLLAADMDINRALNYYLNTQ